MKKTLLLKTVLAGLVLLFMTTNSCLALTISGRITNAKSNTIYLKSSWQRKDTLVLDSRGFFSVSINNSLYEKFFFLTWKGTDGHGRSLSLILEPTDIVRITGDMKGEKIEYIQGDLKKKNYLELLFDKTIGTNHARDAMNTDAEIDSAVLEIFTYLDTLFRVDPILGIECLGLMRRTLFSGEYCWKQLPKILEYIESVPADVKENLPVYRILIDALWPGKLMQELNFLDIQEKVHSTLEIEGKPMLILFGASWCGPCRVNNEALRSKFELLQGKIELLGISIEMEFDNWQAYVNEKNYPWQQGFWVGDENTDREVLGEKYHLYFIPLVVLIDQNRKIISFNPSIDEVFTFLNKK